VKQVDGELIFERTSATAASPAGVAV